MCYTIKSIIYASIIIQSENQDRVVKKSEAKNQEVEGTHIVLKNVLCANIYLCLQF